MSAESEDKRTVIQCDEDPLTTEVNLKVEESAKLSTSGSENEEEANTRNGKVQTTYSCDICAKEFKTKFGLYGHKAHHTVKEEFTCDRCDKIFIYQRNLMKHKEICMERTDESIASDGSSENEDVDRVQQTTCRVCFKEFESLDELRSHNIKEHGGATQKPYNCNTCGRPFAYKSSLEQHIQTAHKGELPFSCDVCNKSYPSKHLLTTHEREHTKEKLFSCDICSKEFHYKSGLYEHKKLHSGNRPFHCLQCRKTFSTKEELETHTTNHKLNPRQFSCDVCDKKFLRRENMRRHKLTHNKKVIKPSKKFYCEMCEVSFPSRDAEWTHKLQHFQKEIEEEKIRAKKEKEENERKLALS